MVEVSQDALDRLAQYWGRAEIMRRHFQDFIESYGGMSEAVAKGNGLRLEGASNNTRS